MWVPDKGIMLDFSYHMEYSDGMTSPGLQRSYPHTTGGPRLDIRGSTVSLPSVSPRGSVVSPRSSFRQKRSQLTLERLQALTPVVNEIDVAAEKARTLFISHLKGQRSVQSIFFPNYKPCRDEVHIDPNWFDFECFASLFVLEAIVNINDPFKINSLIKKSHLHSVLEEVYESAEWKKVGLAMYSIFAPDMFRDPASGVTLRQFINDDKEAWARQLAERTVGTQWLFSVMRNIARGQYNETECNRDMNILFIKLHLLHPQSVMPTYEQLRKGLPDLNLELVTTNYLGGPFDWSVIQEDVLVSLNRISFTKDDADEENGKNNNTAVCHGQQVVDFILTEGKELHLWTGKFPENKRLSKFSDHCVII